MAAARDKFGLRHDECEQNARNETKGHIHDKHVALRPAAER
jgi:hypothetical protein